MVLLAAVAVRHDGLARRRGRARRRDLDYFYPTDVLSTARDILFLWVARMVMSGLSFRDEVPFTDVIIHPTVFNAEGRRMSKSLGTGVDPLDLMEHYGADGMRFGLMLQVTGVQDLKFSEEKLVSSRNFANKIYNASRFVLMNLGEDYEPGPPRAATVADAWILSRLAGLAAAVDEGLVRLRVRRGRRARLYDFFWNEFCDWYIELAKGRLNAGASAEATDAEREARLIVQRNLVFVLDQALRLLHPMMPFVTEEIWAQLPIDEADRAPDAARRGVARRRGARALRRPGRRGLDGGRPGLRHRGARRSAPATRSRRGQGDPRRGPRRQAPRPSCSRTSGRS